jgi:hypothetical protein
MTEYFNDELEIMTHAHFMMQVLVEICLFNGLWAKVETSLESLSSRPALTVLWVPYIT